MKAYIATVFTLFVIATTVQAYYRNAVHENKQWTVDHPLLSREKRGVDLRTLRRLMNNIALSEFYRLRGLEVLGTLGLGHGRPGGIPHSAVQSSSDSSSGGASGKSFFSFPMRSSDFQQFFSGLGRTKLSRRRG